MSAMFGVVSERLSLEDAAKVSRAVDHAGQFNSISPGSVEDNIAADWIASEPFTEFGAGGTGQRMVGKKCQGCVKFPQHRVGSLGAPLLGNEIPDVTIIFAGSGGL
jgi:hypothetical protein